MKYFRVKKSQVAIVVLILLVACKLLVIQKKNQCKHPPVLRRDL